MLRRWSKPALGLVYSLGRIDSGEFVTVLVGHAWRSLSLGGILFYSNILRSFIHASVLFSLPHFQLLLKQQRDNVIYWKTNGKINSDLHLKKLLKITSTAAVVICSGRGGKCNGIYTRGSGRSNHSNDGSKICTRSEVINNSSGSNTCPTYPPL